MADRTDDYERIREDFEDDGIDATDDMIEEKWQEEQREEEPEKSDDDSSW